jgi:magnesium transporter
MDGKIEYIQEYLSILTQEELRNLLAEIDIQELYEVWDSLTDEQAIKIFLNLGMEKKVTLMGLLSNLQQEQLLQKLSVDHRKLLLSEMAPDDLTDFLQSVSAEVRRAVWQSLEDDVKKETLFLLRFDEDDAAGLMTPRYLAVRASITVAQALAFIRKSAKEMETVYYVYVIDELKRLLGVVSLRDILSAEDSVQIKAIMKEKVVTVHEQTDQEDAARIMETYDLLALPVLDSYNRLLGIITVDDVIDVIHEEHTEDVYKMGAMDGSVKKYLETSILGLVKKRIPWLIILLLVGTITTNVLDHYKTIIFSASFLFIFVPIITQTGGNSGNQSTTLMIRGLATGEIRFKDIWRVLGREILVGILLGLGTGVVILLRSFFLPPGIEMIQAVTIGVSLVFVVLFSSLIGALAPLIIDRFGWDPTVMSAPLMATVIDVIGLTIYFETAKIILGV